MNAVMEPLPYSSLSHGARQVLLPRPPLLHSSTHIARASAYQVRRGCSTATGSLLPVSRVCSDLLL